MTKTKSTKRALLMSVVALVMCVSMFVGSTFAWFTDTVTSAGNIIKSGTLDITMEWADGTKAVPAADSSDWTDASTGAIFNSELWEPGYTEVRHIKIANEGTLALKYQLHIVANGEVSNLADVIDVYYIDPAEQINERTQLKVENKVGTLSDVLENLGGQASTAMGNLAADDKETITLALKMQESAGNEYQDIAIGSDFSIVLFATQYTSESDSFDNQYDAGAELPVVAKATSQAELAAAINGGVDTVYLEEGTYKLPATTNNEITLVGNGETVVDLSYATGQSLAGTDITLENLTITGANQDYTGLQHVGNVVYNNVVFNNSTNLYGESVTFNDCTFNLTSRYIWTYGAGVATFNNCTFNTEGKAILAYKESDPATYTVNINNCTFAATDKGYTSSGEHCAAVEIDSSLVGAYVINFDGTNTVSENFADLYRIKKHNNNNVTINQNGTVVTAETISAATQDELNAIVSAGNTVNLDLASGNYTMPDGSEGSLRGKTLTISGTKDTVIDVSNVDTRDQFVTDATIVFDGVTLNFHDGSGFIYMGFANTESLIYRNCHITGLQFLYGENVTFENCVIDSSANTGEPHAVWTYGAKNISFTDCEFIYGHRAINCYKDQDIDGGKQVVNFKNCTFTTTDVNSEGAVEINSSAFSIGIEVNMEGCTAPAYGPMAYVSPWDGTNGAKTIINIQ